MVGVMAVAAMEAGVTAAEGRAEAVTEVGKAEEAMAAEVTGAATEAEAMAVAGTVAVTGAEGTAVVARAAARAVAAMVVTAVATAADTCYRRGRSLRHLPGNRSPGRGPAHRRLCRPSKPLICSLHSFCTRDPPHYGICRH